MPPRRVYIIFLIAALLVTAVNLLYHFTPPSYQPINLTALGSFNLDQINGTNSDIQLSVRALDGKQVEIQGVQSNDVSAGQVVIFDHPNYSHGPLAQDFVVANLSQPKYISEAGDVVRFRGVLHVNVEHEDGPQSNHMIKSVFKLDVNSVLVLARAGGRRTASHEIDLGAWLNLATLILWAILVVPGITKFLRWIDSRRHKLGLCRVCGYDLRASNGRCPNAEMPSLTQTCRRGLTRGIVVR